MAQHLVHKVVHARISQSRVTSLDDLIGRLLVGRYGCPLHLATEAVELEWNSASSPFAHVFCGLLPGERQRAFAFFKQELVETPPPPTSRQ
jgi:hypothetical protein